MVTDRSNREVETGKPGIHWEEASHPVRWAWGWGAFLGVPSALLIAYLGLQLFFAVHFPQPDTYPAHHLPAASVVFWIAVVTVPTIAALLLLWFARRFRTLVGGWLLTFVPVCSALALNIVSFDTHLMNH